MGNSRCLIALCCSILGRGPSLGDELMLPAKALAFYSEMILASGLDFVSSCVVAKDVFFMFKVLNPYFCFIVS